MNEQRGARDYFFFIYSVLKGIVGVDTRRTPTPSISHRPRVLGLSAPWGGRRDHPHQAWSGKWYAELWDALGASCLFLGWLSSEFLDWHLASAWAPSSSCHSRGAQ